MIQAVYGNTIKSYLSLEESRLNTSVAHDNIRYLFKFINDMTGTIKYVYGNKDNSNVTHGDRYIYNTFQHNVNEDIFTFQINLKPYGYWSYEVYEVSWIGTVGIHDDTAPNSETEVLPVNNNNGVVQGKVHQGKLYVSETAGSEQIKYTTHEESSSTNYLYAN